LSNNMEYCLVVYRASGAISRLPLISSSCFNCECKICLVI